MIAMIRIPNRFIFRLQKRVTPKPTEEGLGLKRFSWQHGGELPLQRGPGLGLGAALGFPTKRKSLHSLKLPNLGVLTIL